MKKSYEKPRMEVTEFRFSEHIATSPVTQSCTTVWLNTGTSGCTSGTPTKYSFNNI